MKLNDDGAGKRPYPASESGRVPPSDAATDGASSPTTPSLSGRGLSHDRMSHYLGVATCACGWTGPSDEARAHLLASGRTRSWDEVREERLSRMTPEERGSHERRVAKIVETWRREGLIPDEDETTPARTQTDASAGSEESNP